MASRPPRVWDRPGGRLKSAQAGWRGRSWAYFGLLEPPPRRSPPWCQPARLSCRRSSGGSRRGGRGRVGGGLLVMVVRSSGAALVPPPQGCCLAQPVARRGRASHEAPIPAALSTRPPTSTAKCYRRCGPNATSPTRSRPSIAQSAAPAIRGEPGICDRTTGRAGLGA
jgi:hypothetical protein